MLVLALDTSTPAITAGVVRLDDTRLEVLAEQVTLNARAHGELLTPHLLEAVNAADITLAQLDAIVVGVGPGPFTGLRAGMATGAALGHALGIPVHPVCGLDAIAIQAAHGAPLLVATDARRREVYWAAYDAEARRVDGPHVDKPADLKPEATTAAGEGAELYADVLGLEVVEPRHPSPAGLVAAARESFGKEPEPLTPLYLRRPDAVEPTARKRVTA
ncbi:tRNA (adenosine(37)-N6)-threonylcarbamoyltransferase complex dimerization subunit type 1 TsaB [Amycolatopsis sp. cg5]|uniref:tRNA (adenosine(37)-N6)-threonylcarbamoyltransferase complex dimerization subunit type 1 TsaB n=1 Tax=Amycolatopsis sp. cg5 TaxID=3238802 RepID=UPI0035249E59